MLRGARLLFSCADADASIAAQLLQRVILHIRRYDACVMPRGAPPPP